MDIWRIPDPANIGLLRDKTGLEELPWATGFAPARFYNWQVARASKVDIDPLKFLELYAAIERHEGVDELAPTNADAEEGFAKLQGLELAVVLAVQRIRSGDCAKQVMALLSTMSTISRPQDVLARLSDGLLQRLLAAFDLLQRATHLPQKNWVGRYRPGESFHADSFAAEQIRKLDEHLLLHPPLEATRMFRNIGFIALVSLVRDAQLADLLSQRRKQLDPAPIPAPNEDRFSAWSIRAGARLSPRQRP